MNIFKRSIIHGKISKDSVHHSLNIFYIGWINALARALNLNMFSLVSIFTFYTHPVRGQIQLLILIYCLRFQAVESARRTHSSMVSWLSALRCRDRQIFRHGCWKKGAGILEKFPKFLSKSHQSKCFHWRQQRQKTGSETRSPLLTLLRG